MSPSWKWIPPYRRDRPAWLPASVKLENFSTVVLAGTSPGSIVDLPAATVTVSGILNVSVPTKRLKTVLAAAENVLCPEVYSANGGVTTEGSWYGIHCEPSMSPIPLPGPSQPLILLPA